MAARAPSSTSAMIELRHAHEPSRDPCPSKACKSSRLLLAVLAAAGLIYWFVWRPLPQRSGAIAAEVAAPVSVAFDARGVPHIRAANLEDALFVQGYVTAQDRLWQMDALRRYSAGELAEIVGASRSRNRRGIAPSAAAPHRGRAYITLPAADRAAAAAYARGVNAFIATHLDNLPLEFRLLAIPAAAVERGGYAADLSAHVSRSDHHLEDRSDQAQHAGGRRRR